ncbi:efflux RND transporter periplasmic adaptor subunit [Microbispora bryophytorum]|uniref:efflux RND transporter periplasmic adaptor subunit n=1 Tax=Microbispora bryophytorum TaxID=1460882 RepID=UPI00371A6429
MRSSTPLSVGGLALAGIVIASVAVISATGGDTSVADRIALASVKRGTVASYVSAAGNTIDTGVRDLAFGAEGTVEKVYVKVGQKVRRGKVLAQIDDTIAKENYEAAKAALAAAQETLDDVENGTATTGGAAAPGAGGAGGAGGSGTGAFGGGTGSGGAGGARPPGGGTGGGAGAGNTGGSGPGSGNAGGSGSGNTGGAGAGAGNAGGYGSGTSTGGGGPVACPTPSVRPSGQVTTRPSSPLGSRSSATARPSSRPAAAAAAAAANTGASAANKGASAANKGASAASIGLVAYRGGDHGGADPQPGPAPTATPRPHPHPKPSGPHRPARPHGASAPNPEVSVSILPTAPSRQPSATPSPSGGSSSACAPGQGGQGQGGQGQGSQGQGGQSQGGQGQGGQGQGSQGQGGGAHRRAGFGGGQAGQSGQGAQAGQSGQGAQAGQSGQGAQAGQGGQGGQGGQRGQGGGARLTEAQAEAQVSQATSELAEAKEALAGVRIKAPADGTVMSVAGTVGSRYASGTFITLGDLDDLQVQAMFTESDIRFLKVGQAATVTLATRPGQEYPGTVAHIDPTATTSDRLVRYGVTIVLNSRPARLLLGQSATVRVTTGEAADALYLPSQAVRAQGDGTAVVTVADGGTHLPRTVKVGVRGDSYVEITGGLSEGDQVVLPGASTAFPDEGFPAAR